MAYILRNNLVSPITQLYTFSKVEKKKLIIGLGNITDDYALNRHNVGFMVLDKMAEEFGVGFVTKKDLKSMVAVTQINGQQVILAKPTTYMNMSGNAVVALMQFYKLEPGDVVVIHDELDLQFGDVRLKIGGGPAGNNGIKSVISTIGEDFGRIRVGIGPKVPEQIDSADFVLQDFTQPEQKKLPTIITEAISKAQDFISK